MASLPGETGQTVVNNFDNSTLLFFITSHEFLLKYVEVITYLFAFDFYLSYCKETFNFTDVFSTGQDDKKDC